MAEPRTRCSTNPLKERGKTISQQAFVSDYQNNSACFDIGVQTSQGVVSVYEIFDGVFGKGTQYHDSGLIVNTLFEKKVKNKLGLE